jgi:hypothetical protein
MAEVASKKRINGIPLQLPKIEQNQLPADCGHPLRRGTKYHQEKGQLPNKTASGVSEHIGSAWALHHHLI